MAQLAYYAESFCLTSCQGFRMVQAGDGTGHAQHCPYLTEWRRAEPNVLLLISRPFSR